MFEPHHQPLVPKHVFAKRVAKNTSIALALILASLFIGMAGYHFTEGFGWLDSYLNASMILSGMGPADPLRTSAGKFFAGTYALFSGIIFLFAMAIIMAPVFHRFLHKFHLQAENEQSNTKKRFQSHERLL